MNILSLPAVNNDAYIAAAERIIAVWLSKVYIISSKRGLLTAATNSPKKLFT